MRRRKLKRKSQRQRIAELELRYQQIRDRLFTQHKLLLVFDERILAIEENPALTQRSFTNRAAKIDQQIKPVPARKPTTPRAAFNLRFWKRKPVSLSVIDDEVS